MGGWDEKVTKRRRASWKCVRNGGSAPLSTSRLRRVGVKGTEMRGRREEEEEEEAQRRCRRPWAGGGGTTPAEGTLQRRAAAHAEDGQFQP